MIYCMVYIGNQSMEIMKKSHLTMPRFSLCGVDIHYHSTYELRGSPYAFMAGHVKIRFKTKTLRVKVSVDFHCHVRMTCQNCTLTWTVLVEMREIR